jgi:cytochrome P450
MAFMLGLVADKPNVQNKIVTEFNSAIADEDNISAKEIAKLTYLTGVVQETSRLFPLAWVVPLRNVTDVVLAGKKVKANTPIFLALCAIGE